MLTVVRVDVSNQNCKSTIGFDLLKLLSEPSKLMTGVRSLAKEPPVE